MRVLVTGGTGFIGSHIADYFKKEGANVFVTGGKKEHQFGPDIKFLRRDFAKLDWSILGQIDILFHEAAIADSTFTDKEEMFKINADAALELFQQAVENGCKRIVYASSTAVYGDAPAPYKENSMMQPLNPYGESKKILDEKAMKFAETNPDIKIVGLRYCNVYGSGERYKEKRATMVYQFAQQMLKGNPKIFKYGEQKRDYIYIKDVVRANLLAAKSEESLILNCGSGHATSFNELVEILNSVLGTNSKPEYVDNPYAGRYQDYTECDMTLAKAKMGFVPQFDIRSGIRDYYDSGFLIAKVKNHKILSDELLAEDLDSEPSLDDLPV